MLNSSQIVLCAKVAYEALQRYRESIGEPSTKDSIIHAPLWQQSSILKGVTVVEGGATSRELHESWCADMQALGWQFGKTYDVDAKRHPDLIPFYQLKLEQVMALILFGDVVRAMAKALINAKEGRMIDE